MRTVKYNKHPPTIILTLQSLQEALFKILFSDLLYKTQPEIKPQNSRTKTSGFILSYPSAGKRLQRLTEQTHFLNSKYLNLLGYGNNDIQKHNLDP